jgi:hypothetical protein
MRRIFLIAIIPLVAWSVFAVLYIAQRQAMDKSLQEDDGNGTFHEKKREIAAERSFLSEVFNDDPNPLGSRWYSETTGVSGPPSVIHKLSEHIHLLIAHVTRHHPRLAPPGVYFTLRYLSVPTPYGSTGLSEGTRVICVKDQGAVLVVTTGNLEFEAKRQYLTNNLDVADLALPAPSPK